MSKEINNERKDCREEGKKKRRYGVLISVDDPSKLQYNLKDTTQEWTVWRIHSAELLGQYHC